MPTAKNRFQILNLRSKNINLKKKSTLLTWLLIVDCFYSLSDFYFHDIDGLTCNNYSCV